MLYHMVVFFYHIAHIVHIGGFAHSPYLKLKQYLLI
jgi:hypothetical protein